MSQPAEILVMTWYRREDWEQLLAVFEDAHRLPSAYDQWLELAEAGRRRHESGGAKVEKVYIDPRTFPEWCRKRNLKADAEARARYANELVSLQLMFAAGGPQ